MCIATGFLNCILMDKVQSALFSPYKALVWQTGSKRAFQVVLVFLESIRDISRTGLRLEINPARWHSRPICLNKNKCARDAILDASTPPPRNLIHMTIQTGIWVVIRPCVNADYSLGAQPFQLLTGNHRSSRSSCSETSSIISPQQPWRGGQLL